MIYSIENYFIVFQIGFLHKKKNENENGAMYFRCYKIYSLETKSFKKIIF